MQFYGKCSFDLPALVQSSVGIIDQYFLQMHGGCISTSEFGSSGKMQMWKKYVLYHTFTTHYHIWESNYSTCIHIKQNLRTPGQKKKVYILTSPLLCRHHLQATWKDRQRWKWTIDSWRTYSRYHSCVNRWGKNNENNKWRQQKIVCVCTFCTFFWWKKCAG